MAEANDTEGNGPRNARFGSVEHRHWQEKLTRDLKGKTSEDLTWLDVSGLSIEPLYGDECSVTGTGVPGLGASWQVCVLIDQHDPAGALEAALRAGRGGAEGVSIRIASAPEGPGVYFAEREEFSSFCIALADAGLDVHVEPGLSALSLGEALGPVASMGVDPFMAAAQGASQADVDALMDLAFELFTADSIQGVPFTVNSSAYHGAGASHALELALAYASGVHVLREAHSRGLAVESVASLIAFELAVGTDFFSSIAKLRSARLGWQRISDVLGLNGAMALHVSPSVLHQTTRGRWVNTLRNTAYCFAGAVGGADRITLPSHEFGTEEKGALGDRIARNTQLVLRLESGLDQVKDAAAGSYYLETLTDQTAKRAWDIFQTIEGQGGILKSLASGWISEQIQVDRSRRLSDVAAGDTPILGVSLYPSPEEDAQPPSNLPQSPGNFIVPKPLSWDVQEEGA